VTEIGPPTEFSKAITLEHNEDAETIEEKQVDRETGQENP
jgi:hypothetical protein